MKYKVAFTPEATADLQELFDYIADHTSEVIARNYVTRIYRFCLDLETFPNRGNARDDLLSGLRIVGFQRRVTIAFLVKDDEVSILRIFKKGRDIKFSDADVV